MRIASIEPTVFFVREGSGLRQRVRLRIEDCGTRELALSLRGAGVEERIPLARAPEAGEFDAFLPDLREPACLALGLWAGGALQDEKTVDWQPQKHWEVYLVQYSHHDLGYTDLPQSVLREHARILDDVVRYCEETQGFPEEARFRWLVEQAWSVVQFVETRPPEDVARLVAAIRRGQIEVTALFGNMTSELCGHEQLIRLLYPAFALKRAYGIDIACAEHNDIPGFSWGLANVLAGAGVRYFSPGIPSWYFEAVKPVHPLWDEAAVLSLKRPGAFWWEGIDGSRVLLWFDLHGGEWHPTSYEHALRELPGMLADLDAHGYAYDMVSYTLRGGHRDNAPAVDRYAYLVKAWNERWAYPRLINSTDVQFLSAFEDRWGHALKTLRGEAPGTDYPTGATCTPRETALNRNAHDWLLSAEKLATVGSIVAGYQYPKATIDEAYRDTLYFDEHCWGMWHPGGPAQDGCWREKGGFAYRAAALAHDVTVKAANRIVDEVTYPDDAYYLTVFNTLSCERSDVVRAPLRLWNSCGLVMHWRGPQRPDEGAVMASGGAIGRGLVDPPASLFEAPFRLVDVVTGQAIPYQLARVKNPQAAQPWAAERVAMGKVDPAHDAEIVFLAEGLPAMGYRTYKVEPCAGWPAFADDTVADTGGMENRYYRLTLDPETRTIASLVDKELGRELVDQGAFHGLGEVLARSCETGQEERIRVPSISIAETGPVYTTLRLNGSVLGCPSVTEEITLYHGLKRIDVSARLLRDSTPNLELYCAFPFQVEGPRFRYESADTVIEPLRDQLPGSNTDYYAAQHWAEVYNDEYGVVWSAVDAPMVEFGGLWPGYVSGAHHGVTGPNYGHPFLRPGELRKGHVYSLLMYNNFRTNFVNVHPGESLFRWSFTSRAGERWPGAVPAFGWSVANPPLGVWMKGPRSGSLGACASFVQVDAPNVMLLTMKRAEDGAGYILRLIEMEGQETAAVVTVPALSILRAYATNLVEENQALVPCATHSVQAVLRPYGIVTIRLVTQ